MKSVLAGFDILFREEDCIQALPQGLVKSLAKDFLSLRKVSTESLLVDFAKTFLTEILAHKAGIVKDPTDTVTLETDRVLAASTPELAKICVKLCHAKVPREENPAYEVVDRIASKFPPKEPKEQKEPKDGANPSAPTNPANEVPAADQKLDKDGQILQVGDKVRTIAHKRKDLYDQQEGEVVALNAKKAKILLPSQEKKDYEYKNLVLLKSHQPMPSETTASPKAAAQKQTDLTELLGKASDLLD